MAKLKDHYLNPDKEKDKAEAFKLALGYTSEHSELLIFQVLENLRVCEAIPKGDNGWGLTYEVVMNLTGANGKTARVITAWIDDKVNNEMRLTAVYIDGRKKK
ncbi:MAG: hypothetical protein LBN97_08280 [Oscillospiraceae bacterium]|nr:hypothetical protein [Oscillospiraceae bacterium]